MAQKIGENITIIDKGEYFLFRVRKDADLTDSSNGRTKILASSKGFQTVENEGDHLTDFDIGVNMVLTVREKKGKTKQKPNSKKKSARMDDDD